MDKKVKLSLKGIQRLQGEQNPDAVETIYLAEYHRKNDSHYFIYEEWLEGIEHPLKNRIKVKGAVVEVIKKGSADVHMIFEENKEYQTSYRTPYGEFLFTICTNSVEVAEEADGLMVRVAYTLKALGERLSDHKLEIRAEAVQ